MEQLRENPPERGPIPGDLGWEPLDLSTADISALLVRCEWVDAGVPAVGHMRGGSGEGYARWEAFRSKGLDLYAAHRNNALKRLLFLVLLKNHLPASAARFVPLPLVSCRDHDVMCPVSNSIQGISFHWLLFRCSAQPACLLDRIRNANRYFVVRRLSILIGSWIVEQPILILACPILYPGMGRDGVSRLSAYHHFGMISPFKVARDALLSRSNGAAKYVDEFFTWREVAHAFCLRSWPTLESLQVCGTCLSCGPQELLGVIQEQL